MKSYKGTGYIGGRHTAIEHLPKGLPSDKRGEVERAVKRLIKQGWIVPKTTSYGIQVSLVAARIKEIKQILGEQEGADKEATAAGKE